MLKTAKSDTIDGVASGPWMIQNHGSSKIMIPPNSHRYCSYVFQCLLYASRSLEDAVVPFRFI